MLNRCFPVYHFYSLLFFFFWVIFLVGSLEITINILIYSNLVQINSNLFLIVFKTLIQNSFIPSHFMQLMPYKLHIYAL